MSGAGLGPLLAIRDVGLRMLRNKRRSMAMLMGVVFCVLIISSVSLFNDVLIAYMMNQEIDAIPFMVSIQPEGEMEESVLLELADKVRKDDRAHEVAVVAGPPPMVDMMDAYGFRGGPSDRGISSGNEWIITVDSGLNETKGIQWGMSPMFIREGFTATDMYERALKEDMAGTFDLWSGNRTVIPRSMAEGAGLGLGDVAPRMTVTGRNFGSRDGANGTLVLENVTISGIVDWTSLMGVYTSREELYLATEVLYEYDNTLLPFLEDNGMFSILVRLDLGEFNTQDRDTFENQVIKFIGDITDKSEAELEASYFIGFTPAGATLILSVVLMFIFLILTLPVLALSIYLLVFGLELSLEDRRREIGILKAQGASAWQIFRMLAAETGLLFVVGAAAGFVLSFLVAWAMISTTGFLLFEFSQEKLEFILSANVTAFIKALVWSLIVVGLIVVLLVFRKGRSFIDMQVSEAVARGDHKKKSIIRKLKIDIILFIIGLIAGGFIIINDLFLSQSNDFGTTSCLLGLAYFFGPFTLWVGGALVGPPVASWLLLRGQKLVLKLPAFSDIGLVLKSGLKRRTHVAGLAVLIILAMSVATMAATQSYTDQMSFVREAEYSVGADLNVRMSTAMDITEELEAVDGVEAVSPVVETFLTIENQGIMLYAMDSDFSDSLRTHDDSFTDMTASEAFSELAKTRSNPGVFLDQDTAYWMGISKGDVIELEMFVMVLGIPESELDQFAEPGVMDPGGKEPGYGSGQTIKFTATVVAIYDHLPPGISEGLVCDIAVVEHIQGLLTGDDVPDIMASTYLVELESGADRTEVKRDIKTLQGVSTVLDIEEEKEFKDTFGISGLLTLMLVLSLVGLIIGSFTFSSILMQRRMREFALLQTLGATRGQVYKVAVGENILLLTMVIIWGVLLGLLLSYVVNGFFFVIRQLFSETILARTIFIPWPVIIGMAVLALLGMLLVMIVAAIRAARQDLSVSTRVI